jgi:predicted helicase
MTQNLERLRSIKTFPSLVKYLRDELDWPIESEDVEELSFDYEPEELGLDPKTAVKIKEIKQLRPFVTGQPWGIFFISFEPKRLPIVALRRILRSLVLKKRQASSKSQQATWQLNDLMFISSYGETDEREISFAHFSDDDSMGDLPTLKVLGWNAQNTVLRLEDTQEVLKEKLHWPEDENEPDAWRQQWSSAFKLQYRETIRTSRDLAIKLADLATLIRARVNDVLEVESESGELRKLYKAFQEALIHDLTEDDFADMYAQTIAYGLLTASISRQSGGLVADNLKDMVPNTNPFLKELMQTFLTVGGRKGRIDFDELGINDVVELLRHTQMDEVLKDFGAKNPQEDPVIHFYELFLKEYDPEKRMKRGVFYTPRPVVSFIVRSVDEILRTEFGLEDGLADTTTWGEMAARRNSVEALLGVRPLPAGVQPASAEGRTQSSAPTTKFAIPEGVRADEPFVQILDPATGTGTFLVEVIDRIYATLRDKWQQQGKSETEMYELWNDYVPRHLLPRLHGFELMMAPYAIAHMKIGLKLRETQYSFLSSERARVYLTNTLEEPKDFSTYFEHMVPALAHEAHAANRVKRNTPITVVIGNPPYSGHSENIGQWINDLLRGKDTLTDENIGNYFEVDGRPLGERNPKWLNDDYVKFLRYGQRRLEQSNVGILSYISNHSYLDNPTFRGMRKSLLDTFSRICVLDLHGNSKKREVSADGSPDENVFDIQQGVAISVMLRNIEDRSSTRHKHLFGSREEKYKALAQGSLQSISLTELSPSRPFYLFFPQDALLSVEYEAGLKITEAMPVNLLGFQTHRDNIAIAFDDSTLLKQVSDHLGRRPKAESWNKYCQPIDYRPFDTRWAYLAKEITDRPRLEVTEHLFKENLAVNFVRQTKADAWRHILVSRRPTPAVFIEIKDGSSIFPLYLYAKEGLFGTSAPKEQLERHANMKARTVSQFSERLKVVPAAVGKENSGTIKVEDIFHYVYGISHSPTYRSRYSEFLKIDFPRIPLTSNLEMFLKVCTLGADLVALHLLEDEYEVASWNTVRSKAKSPLKNLITRFIRKGALEVAKGYPKYKDTNVYINTSSYFEGVPEEVWNFHIGGYQVCEKWLKDRRGRTLSDEDINHYQRVVVALSETIRLMAEIDRVIEEHGGWPLVGSQDVASRVAASTTSEIHEVEQNKPLPFE